MASFNDVIARSSNGTNLIPQQISTQILQMVENESVAMQLFPRVSMGTNQTDLPCLSALPYAYFRDSDTALVQTTSVNWDKKYLYAKGLSCIVPIPIDLLSDMQYDPWGQVTKLIAQAVARTLDGAVLFGTNKPSAWPNDILTDAVAKSFTVTRGAASQATGGLRTDISNLMGLVEGAGFDVNGAIANVKYKGYTRNAVSSTGLPFQEISPTDIFGTKMRYPAKGLWPSGSGKAELIVGDFENGLLGVRQDMYYTVLKEATLVDGDGKPTYNLPQQHMVALMIDSRFAFQVANVINWQQQTAASRYPWAVMLSA